MPLRATAISASELPIAPSDSVPTMTRVHVAPRSALFQSLGPGSPYPLAKSTPLGVSTIIGSRASAPATSTWLASASEDGAGDLEPAPWIEQPVLRATRKPAPAARRERYEIIVGEVVSWQR